MKLYSFDDIKNACDCRDIARVIGVLNGHGDRCAAVWRGGENKDAVHFNKDGFMDFGAGEQDQKGSVIDLVAIVKFGGDRQRAQEWLGEYLGLQPKITKLKPNPTDNSRYSTLIEDGYTETARYDYTDAAGRLLYQVIRMEHPERKKEFLQQGADGRWNIKGISRALYRLPEVIAADTVYIPEGEKDVETIRSLGLIATTNSGGATHWQADFGEFLRGKDIVILPDADEPGENHATVICCHLAGVARSIKIVRMPKGKDITDWIKQGGTREALEAMVAATPQADADTEQLKFESAKANAKEANKQPFQNFTIRFDENGKPSYDPRHANDMVQDVFTRFLGFPRRIGDELFDHDKSGGIVYLRSVHQFVAWVSAKSNQVVGWRNGDRMISKAEFYEAIQAAAKRYESISHVPEHPGRDDTYYCFGRLPKPNVTDSLLDRLAGMFCCEKPEYLPLVKCLFAAPMFYRVGIPRPTWIIDSEAPGSGKSTLAESVALLYGRPAIGIHLSDFRRDVQEITKRLVSSEGRQSRVVLIDNATGTVGGQELASLITRSSISGKAPYGRGEESRPNNLTWIITSNNASIDNDISMRSYFISMQRINQYISNWAADLYQFILLNRLQIFSDILYRLKFGPRCTANPQTRFPEFETEILFPLCKDEDEYEAAMDMIRESKREANIEAEWGAAIEDVFRFEIASLGADPDHESLWIRTHVAEAWTKKAIPDIQTKSPIQFLRGIARSGHCPSLDPSIKKYPHGQSPNQRRGIMWQKTGRAARTIFFQDQKPVIGAIVF